uniref:hypothetical protein n=1 Tax=Eubacterium sp. TaxID=142586 RepID=UPI003FF06C94
MESTPHHRLTVEKYTASRRTTHSGLSKQKSISLCPKAKPAHRSAQKAKEKNKKAPELTGVVFFHIFRYEVANIRSLVRLLLKPFNHIRLSIPVKSKRELS